MSVDYDPTMRACRPFSLRRLAVETGLRRKRVLRDFPAA